MVCDICAIQLLDYMAWCKSWVASKLGADGGIALAEVKDLLRYHGGFCRIVNVRLK